VPKKSLSRACATGLKIELLFARALLSSVTPVSGRWLTLDPHTHFASSALVIHFMAVSIRTIIFPDIPAQISAVSQIQLALMDS
jgi:hypothetical protein